MLRNVAVLALPEVGVFELGVLCELFGSDRTADGLPGYDFAVCTVDGRPVRTGAGRSTSVSIRPLCQIGSGLCVSGGSGRQPVIHRAPALARLRYDPY